MLVSRYNCSPRVWKLDQLNQLPPPSLPPPSRPSGPTRAHKVAAGAHRTTPRRATPQGPQGPQEPEPPVSIRVLLRAARPGRPESGGAAGQGCTPPFRDGTGLGRQLSRPPRPRVVDPPPPPPLPLPRAHLALTRRAVLPEPPAAPAAPPRHADSAHCSTQVSTGRLPPLPSPFWPPHHSVPQLSAI